MWEKIRVVFTIPELRQKILLTLLFLAIYRVGWHIPLPIVDSDALKNQLTSEAGTFGAMMDQVATLTASDLSQVTIFGLGIMPYISASIIFQLLGTVWGPLERLKKEGAAGQKKINEYTRYATVVICLFQSYVYLTALSQLGVMNTKLLDSPFTTAMWYLTSVLVMTCGTTFLMWLGEQIDEYGIGNGISLLIMAGILARMPSALQTIVKNLIRADFQLSASGGGMGIDKLLLLIFLFIGIIAGVVYITLGQRQIPIISAKHMQGRRVSSGGGKQYLPIRVNQAGVMPIIFASSLLLFPAVIFSWGQRLFESDTTSTMFNLFDTLSRVFQRGDSFFYNAFYVGLIYFFCYFWTAITFNPKDMAENLKNNGTFIKGYKPGKSTASYLEKVMTRVTYVGAGFLAFVAITPTIINTMVGIDFKVASFYGGTGLLIAVSVAFDLVQKIDNHLLMRDYEGLMETK